MSTRWSYGPDGLRERPVKGWSNAELLPRWRDLQPLLIRSAGVVGLVAMIMVVVSSDALRFGGEAPRQGRSAGPVEATDAPLIAAAAELRAAELPAEEPAAIAPTVAAPQPAAPAPQPMASAAPPPASRPEPATASMPEQVPTPIAATPSTPQPAPVPAPVPAPTPVVLASADEPAPEAAAIEAPPAAAIIPDLRTGRASAQPPSAVPLTTASVPEPAIADPAPPAIGVDDAPAEISLAAIRPSDVPERGTVATQSLWPEGAATCPRDWVPAAASGAGGESAGECTAIAALLAPVAEDDQSALEAAASEEAATIAAFLPRLPLPRPDPEAEPPAPRAQQARVRHPSSWPDAPPPDCPAGRRAKWRFVDRGAGTKEWYCR